MGIKLVVEVLDRYHGPNPRKLWLIAFAEAARDQTRTGWQPRKKLAHRVGVSEPRASNIAAELVAEGVIKRDGGGFNGKSARYVLLPLADEIAPEAANAAHDAGDRRVTPERTLKSHATANSSGGERVAPEPTLKGSPSRTKGHPKANSTPHDPSDNPSSPSGADTAPSAQRIITEFIDWDRANGGQLSRRTVGHLAKQIGELTAEGFEESAIKNGLATWRKAKMHPATLPSFVEAAIGGSALTSRRQSETNAQIERWLARARAADAAERGNKP